MLGDLGSILLAALGISFLIFIHELGHFLAARAFGVRVETFSIGFGPRLFGWRRGQTDYRLSLVPLGGYVKMAGEYGDLRDGAVLAADDLSAKPPWQRAIIFAGGVIVNVLFAFVAFPVAFALGVPFTAPVVGSITPGEQGVPAWQADLRPGDEVLSVDGHRVYQFQDIALEVALADPQHTLLRVRRDGREFDVVVHSGRNQEQGRWEIGIGPAGDGTIAVEKGKAAATAGLRTGDELLAVDGVPLAPGDRPELALERLFEHGGSARISARRGDQTIEVTLEPKREEIPGKRLLGITPVDTRVVALRRAALDARFPLQPGDVVLEVAGQPVAGADEILQRVAEAPPGPVTLAVERDGESVVVLAPEQRALLADDVAFDIDTRGTAVRVIPEGALAAAGMRDGDVITALNGEPVHDYDTLQKRAGNGDTRFHVDFLARADGELHAVDVETRLPVRWDYGVFARMLETRQQESFTGALRAGVVTSLNMLRTTWLTLKKLVTGDVAANNLGGIVSISVLTYQFADTGLTKLLYFLGLLSINLAFINVLPIPVLDGGQMLFLLLEKLKGGRLSERFMNAAQLAGLLAIVALVLYVTYNDITRLVG